MIGFGVKAIFVYKGLTRNPEIGNTHVCVLPNTWRLGGVRDTKFGTKVSNKMLLSAAKCITTFTVSELLRKNKQGGGGNNPPHPD